MNQSDLNNTTTNDQLDMADEEGLDVEISDTEQDVKMTSEKLVEFLQADKLTKINPRHFGPVILELVEKFRSRVKTLLSRPIIDIDPLLWLEGDDDGCIPTSLAGVYRTLIHITTPKIINHVSKLNKNDIVFELSGHLYYVVCSNKSIVIFNSKKTKVENKHIEEEISQYFTVGELGLYQVMYDRERKLFKIIDVMVYDKDYLGVAYPIRILNICKNVNLVNHIYNAPIPGAEFKLIKTNKDLMFSVDHCIHIKPFEQVAVIGRTIQAFDSISMKQLDTKPFISLFIKYSKSTDLLPFIQERYPDYFSLLQGPTKHIESIDVIKQWVRPLLSKMLNIESFKAYLRDCIHKNTNTEWFTEHWLCVSPQNGKLQIINTVPVKNITLPFVLKKGKKELYQEYKDNITGLNKNNIISTRYLDTAAIVVYENKTIKDTLQVIQINSINDLFNIKTDSWVVTEKTIPSGIKRLGMIKVVDYMRMTSSNLEDHIKPIEEHYKNTKYWHGYQTNKRRRIE